MPKPLPTAPTAPTPNARKREDAAQREVFEAAAKKYSLAQVSEMQSFIADACGEKGVKPDWTAFEAWLAEKAIRPK